MFLTPLNERNATRAVQQFRAHYERTATLCGNRANRAATISSTAEMVETTDDPDVYLVHSESNSLGMYTVNVREKTCTCPDHGRQAEHGIICKHRLAVAYLLNLIVPPTPPAPTTTQADLEAQRYTLANQLCTLADQIKMFPGVHRTEANRQKVLDLLRRLNEIESAITNLPGPADPFAESSRPKRTGEIIIGQVTCKL